MTQRFHATGYLRVLIAVWAPLACRGAPAKKEPPATPVRVSAVSTIDAPVVIRASGVVEPMQTVAVTTQTSGALIDVLFHEGDFVERGQILFHLDRRPLEAALDQATATLARDVAQAAAAKHDDERYSTLATMGYVSRSQADQMHATAVAQAATVEADRAAQRSAQVNLGFTTIRAPISGRTGALLVRAGNNVSPTGGPLVVINQLSPVLVRFPILQQDFVPLQNAVAAHPLTVQAASSDSTQARETGKLSFLDNAVDSLTGTVTGKANFPNASRRLWPGELVFLTVQLDVQHGVLAVPNDAVLMGPQGPYVFLVSDKGTATMQGVVTGLQAGDMTVVQRGLTLGQRVIIDGQSRVNPGARVAVVTGAPGGDSALANQVGAQAASTGAAAGDVTTGRAGAAGSAASPTTSNGPATTAPATTAPTATSPTTTSPTTTSPTTTSPTTTTPRSTAPTTTAPTTTAPTPTRTTTPPTATPPSATPPATGTRPPAPATPPAASSPSRP